MFYLRKSLVELRCFTYARPPRFFHLGKSLVELRIFTYVKTPWPGPRFSCQAKRKKTFLQTWHATFFHLPSIKKEKKRACQLHSMS